MAKSKFEITNAAFQTSATSLQGNGFNLVTNASSLNSVFDFKPLDEEEAQKIDKLLSENAQQDVTDDEKLSADIKNIKAVSAEIKSIGKQGTILIGERIRHAQEVLMPYRNGTFSKWLELTFGSRKTGYNLLAYHELFISLPHDDTRELFKKIAQRPAYILASREGDLEKKIDIIKNSKGLEIDELVTLIQDTFPTSSGDKRASRNVSGNINRCFITSLRSSLQKLNQNKNSLTQDDMDELRSLKALWDSLIS